MSSEPFVHRRPVRRSLVSRTAHVAAVTLCAVALAGLAAGGVAVLQMRAAAETANEPAAPIAVATTRIDIVDQYVEAARYTGRIEPARRTELAFERGGLVTGILVDEGSEVREGQVVARLDTAQLEASRRQLEGRRRELDAQKTLAELTRNRQSQLQTRGWSPEQRLDDAEASVAQLAAAIDQVSAQIAGIDIDLSKSAIRAPFNGRIAARSIDDGAVVAAGAPVLSLLEAGRRQARIGLPPDIARGLDTHATYRLTAGSDEMTARIAAVRPDLDTPTRTTTVLFDIVDTASSPALGDLVRLEFENRIAARGAWVPVTALKEGRRGLWTLLVVERADGEARVRTEAAEVLHAQADRVFVRGTFRNGERVLSTGIDRAVSGQRVALADGR